MSTTQRRNERLLALTLAFLLCLASLGTASAQGVSGPVTIEMGERGNEYYFEPKEVTVPAGTVSFIFRNAGARRHNWVVKLPGGDVRTPDVNAGQTHEQAFTFTQPGTYDVLCDLPTHAQRGMVMKLTVAGAAAAPQAQAPQAQAPLPANPQPAIGATPIGSGPAPLTGATGAARAPNQTTSTAAPTQAGTSAAGWPLLVSLAIHIPAAIAWLGVVLYDAIIVAVPFLTPAQRGSLLRRPRWIILATIPLFMATGIYQTIYNPFSTITDYAGLYELRATTAYGQALFWKHGFVLASMAATLAVTFWFAPRLVAFADDVQDGAPSRTPALLTWVNVAACVALLGCVAVMVYQLH